MDKYIILDIIHAFLMTLSLLFWYFVFSNLYKNYLSK